MGHSKTIPSGEDGAAVNATRPEVHGYQALFRCSKTLVIVISCFFSALLAGTTNAFNPIASNIQKDVGLSSEQTNVLTSFALVGTFFTLPAGLCNDSFGPFRTALIGVTGTGLGYIILSFLNHEAYAMMVIAICLTGFGGGFTFTAALATGIRVMRMHPGVVVFIVGAAMSLSLAFASAAIQLQQLASGCQGAGCWRENVRMLGIVATVVQLPAAFFAFRLFELSPEFADCNDSEAASGTDLDSMDSSLNNDTVVYEKVSFVQSLAFLKNLFAWVMGIAYTIGIGSGLVVISQVEGLILNYGGESSWVFAVSTSFSFANALIGGGLSGMLGDALSHRFPTQLGRPRIYAIFLFCASILCYILGILSAAPEPHDTTSQIFFCIFLVLVGVCFGTNFVFGPSIIGETFGGRNFGVFFGYMQLLTAAATFAVPSIVGANLENAGNAAASFFGFQYLLGFISLVLFFVKPAPLSLGQNYYSE